MHDTSPDGTIVWPAGRNTDPIIRVQDVSLWYGATLALDGVSFDLYSQEILALMGPSGCGKSTALKLLNRMHDGARGVRIEGQVTLEGRDVHAGDVDPPTLRRRFGWVAQKPNPFAMSIFENVAYAARLHGVARPGGEMELHVETCLRRAHLWDEVKDDLHKKDGTALSGGQQQRLCIARALGYRPDVILMDEPTGSIDPVATGKIEELMLELREDHALVVITHSMMQARRVADRVAHFHLGRLLEIGPTQQVFDAPCHPETQRFIAGRIG